MHTRIPRLPTSLARRGRRKRQLRDAQHGAREDIDDDLLVDRGRAPGTTAEDEVSRRETSEEGVELGLARATCDARGGVLGLGHVGGATTRSQDVGGEMETAEEQHLSLVGEGEEREIAGVLARCGEDL